MTFWVFDGDGENAYERRNGEWRVWPLSQEHALRELFQKENIKGIEKVIARLNTVIQKMPALAFYMRSLICSELFGAFLAQVQHDEVRVRGHGNHPSTSGQDGKHILEAKFTKLRMTFLYFSFCQRHVPANSD